MSEATRRLSSACKLHSNINVNNNNSSGGSNTSGGNSEETIIGSSLDESLLDSKEKILLEQRKNSVGNEMVMVLQVLGKVSFVKI